MTHHRPITEPRPSGSGLPVAIEPAGPIPAGRGRAARDRGFTLMELLVAVSLTLLMMGLISVIFDQARSAVSRGTGIGDITANGNSLSSLLRMDAGAMLGPQDNQRTATAAGAEPGDASGGYLVIVQRTIGDWNEDGTFDGDNGDGRLTVEDGTTNLSDPSLEGVLFQTQNGQLERRMVRSDQLSFIARRGQGQQPLTPATDDSFVPFDDQGLARFVRVWYGHVSRLNRDGSEFDVATPDDPMTDGHLGRPGADLYGNRFIVGRQALFLGETATTALPHPALRVQDTGDGIGPLADIIGISGAVSPTLLYRAYSDYANFSFDDPTHGVGRVVGDATGTAINPILAADVPVSNQGYNDAAVAYLTFSNKRLRVNPQPDEATWESWRIAQMHPYLMEYASDFIVEFAADMDLDGRADSILELAGATGTYAGDVDNELEDFGGDDYYTVTGTDGLTYRFPPSTLVWYTAPALANDGILRTYDPSKPLTFAYDDALLPAAAYEPMIDRSGTGGPPHADYTFVFRHDDENGKYTGGPSADQSSLWPYLLRVRYRLHDPRGQVMSGQGQHGIWFEQVLTVPRPTN